MAAASLLALGFALGCRAAPPRRVPPPGQVVAADATESPGGPLLIRSAALGLSEPSGIAFHAALDHLFVVGDRGAIAELDRDGHLLRVGAVGGDLEDVVVHPPSGELLLVSESAASLIRLDPRTLAERGRCRLDAPALLGVDRTTPRAGFEGIAFRPHPASPGGGVLSLAHQRDPAAVVHLALDPAAPCAPAIGAEGVRERWRLRHCSLKALTFSTALGRYLAIDGRRDELLVLGAAGRLQAVRPLPGVQPEGLCFDTRGTLWIADDRRGVWRWSGALVALTASLREGLRAQ